MSDALRDYGRGEALAAHFGLTPEVGVKIAAIITFAGAIETISSEHSGVCGALSQRASGQIPTLSQSPI